MIVRFRAIDNKLLKTYKDSRFNSSFSLFRMKFIKKDNIIIGKLCCIQSLFKRIEFPFTISLNPNNRLAILFWRY
jgi:hypothetical protein